MLRQPESSERVSDHVQTSARQDRSRFGQEGVTSVWTVFHLYNYFGRYFANFGNSANFWAKKPKLTVARL